MLIQKKFNCSWHTCISVLAGILLNHAGQASFEF
jgi:hypothetical protein